MLHRSGGGHYGGSLSAADILVALLTVTGPTKDNRLILSKGHAAAALYAALAAVGTIPEAELRTYGKFGSRLQGHPDMVSAPFIHFSTGSLGQGLSAGLGMALVMRERSSIVTVLLGDGECQEGQVWEAAMVASRFAVSNLRAIVDANNLQEWNLADECDPPVPNLADKWRAFGWSVMECNGHDVPELVKTLKSSSKAKMPLVIIAQTQKGRGSSLLMSDPNRFHCSHLSNEEYARVLAELVE
jgi:transketolase